MNYDCKTVLQINLTNRTSQVKIYKDLNCYIGGVGLALAIIAEIKDSNPLVFCTGPLGGFFPYASKIIGMCIYNNTLCEAVGGGRMSLMMNLAGLDAIVITGQSQSKVAISIKDQQANFFEASKISQRDAFKNEGLPSKRSLIEFTKNCLVDSHFSFGSNELATAGALKNLKALLVTGTQSFAVASLDYYRRIYFDILSRPSDLAVPFMGYRSCAGCPAGCKYSKNGEGDVNIAVLPRCLVACQFAQNIYNDIPRVFSCLASIGYHYNHEDLEGISERVGKLHELLNRQLESQ
ncbi:hypothetical protein L6255_02400 [Candidatus Parcubacteria bacterium]|nr:hypothetical protein [Patescibacteria group bacterium]MCG2689268.1 hypothetical protein [Candidatus Parcubacteria bacterium]